MLEVFYNKITTIKLSLFMQTLTLYCIMCQNGQTHFKNLAAFAARFWNVSDHFGTLCIKGLIYNWNWVAALIGMACGR